MCRVRKYVHVHVYRWHARIPVTFYQTIGNSKKITIHHLFYFLLYMQNFLGPHPPPRPRYKKNAVSLKFLLKEINVENSIQIIWTALHASWGYNIVFLKCTSIFISNTVICTCRYSSFYKRLHKLRLRLNNKSISKTFNIEKKPNNTTNFSLKILNGFFTFVKSAPIFQI